MAYDETLAERIRAILHDVPLGPDERVGEKKMFGGLCFTLNDKMTIGLDKSRVMVRLTTEEFEAASSAGTVTEMDYTGRPLRNFAFLCEHAYASDRDLANWIAVSVDYVRKNMLDKPAPKKRGKR